ncbi:facilitated trehalose transporter Tret1-like [Aricia agestis]|uniref:facilitated trehalose transporter Tret1-like n=1 Tax=Aricia agestis TaxID=91739 RepID=UPI001C2091A1|nr:facilitated trehalose transporter Tret1-like [Aricia agestis]
MLIFGRAIVMSLETLLFSAVPVYSSEIANKEQRGALGTLLQISVSLGMVVSLSVGPYTSYVTFNIVVACAIAITMIPLLFLPDSPYYLYSKGRIEESRAVLTLIRGSETLVEEEIDGYEKAKESKVDVSKMALIRNRMFRKSLILGLMLGIGTTLLGFTAVTFYLQTILETTGVSLQPEISSVISGVIQLVGSACSTPITRNFARKSILKISLTGYAIGMIFLGVFFKVTEPEDFIIEGFLNYLPIISLVTVIFCYNVGIGSLYFLIAAELFDDIGRAFGFSIFLATTTFLTFLVTRYFSLMTNILGPAVTYWIFSGFTMMLIILITLFLPETKGKTFSQIQQSLDNTMKNDNVETGLKQ